MNQQKSLVEKRRKEQMSPRTSAILDRVGVCASTLCAIHCLLTGIAMGFLAVAGLEFLGNPVVEVVFVGSAIIVGGWAVWHGVKRHHSKLPASIFALGLACIVGSHFAGHQEGNLSGTILAILGGLLIASFHVLNQRMQHKGCGCSVDRNAKAD